MPIKRSDTSAAYFSAKNAETTERLFLRAAEAVGNEDLARYVRSIMDDEEEEADIDKDKKIAYNRDNDDLG